MKKNYDVTKELTLLRVWNNYCIDTHIYIYWLNYICPKAQITIFSSSHTHTALFFFSLKKNSNTFSDVFIFQHFILYFEVFFCICWGCCLFFVGEFRHLLFLSIFFCHERSKVYSKRYFFESRFLKELFEFHREKRFSFLIHAVQVSFLTPKLLFSNPLFWPPQKVCLYNCVPNVVVWLVFVVLFSSPYFNDGQSFLALC